MAKHLLHSRFNRRIKFGTVASVPNRLSGDNDLNFVAQFNVWCMPQKRTMSQQYELVGTELEGSINVVIRHNAKVSDALKAEYLGELYDIKINSVDDGNDYLAYDYLTLKRSSKVG